MNERFIAISGDGIYGSWGTGSTLESAKANLRKAGVNEADCWVGRDGSVNWVRCEREWLAA